MSQLSRKNHGQSRATPTNAVAYDGVADIDDDKKKERHCCHKVITLLSVLTLTHNHGPADSRNDSTDTGDSIADTGNDKDRHNESNVVTEDDKGSGNKK